MGFLDLSNVEITAILVGTGFAIAAFMCTGLCFFLHIRNSSRKKKSGSFNSHSSLTSGLIKEQSRSVVNGEHPITFVLPTVSLSETASEVSDLDGMATGYSSSTSISHPPSLIGGISLDPKMRPMSYTRLGEDDDHGSLPRKSSRNRRTSDRKYFSHRPQLHHQPTAVGDDLYRTPRLAKQMAPSSQFGFSPRPSPGQGSLHRKPSFLRHNVMRKNYYSGSPGPDPGLYGEMQMSDYASGPENQGDLSYCSFKSSDAQILGKINFQVQIKKVIRRGLCTLQLSNFQLSELDQSSFPMNRSSLKMTVLPDYSEHRESLMGLVENGQVGFQETVEWDNLKLEEDVVKLTVMIRGIPRRKVYGHALLQLGHLMGPSNFSGADEEDGNHPLELIIYSSVSEKLDELYSDFLDLSLSYDMLEGILTLGIIRARLASISTIDPQASLYVKVTLFEASSVIKAKKTRLVAIKSQTEFISFFETFSILFPQDFLQDVSCIISLCGKSKLGQKFVVGRTSIGGSRQCSPQGLEHWHQMTQNQGNRVEKRHKLL